MNIVTVALRDIAPGEELLVSYGKKYWNELVTEMADDCTDGIDGA